MTDAPAPSASLSPLLRLTAEIAAAYLGHNAMPAPQVPDLIRMIHAALQSLEAGPSTPTGGREPLPAVPVNKSVFADYIICLEDGKRMKMLKRHLRTAFGMTPEQYRAKWRLPPDYPMVARNYARQRSDFAKRIGLGHTAGARRGRPPKKS